MSVEEQHPVPDQAGERVSRVTLRDGSILRIATGPDGTVREVVEETVLLPDESRSDGPGGDWGELSAVEKAFFRAVKGDTDLIASIDAFNAMMEKNGARWEARMADIDRSIDAYWAGRRRELS